jgi:hypothetical protein
LYEKAITAWRATKQPHPRCGGHSKLAKKRVVRNLMKASYGRPFFVCSNKLKPCSFWVCTTFSQTGVSPPVSVYDS